MNRQAHLQRRRQRGLSLVELMVGIAVGMFVVAGATMLTATQLTENRKLTLEAQVNQDMRASLDIIARELRRSGSRAVPHEYVWTSSATGLDAGALDDATPTTGLAHTSLFQYNRSGVLGGTLGFRLNGAGTAVETRLTALRTWNELNDVKSLQVTTFDIQARHVEEPTPAAPEPQKLPCPKLCPDGTDSCWPTVRVREFTVTLSGRATTDAAVRRTATAVIRPRNNQLLPITTPNVCPA